MTGPADPDQPGAEAPTTAGEEPKPFFSVVSGNPSPAELAALTVVLAAAASGGDEEEPSVPVTGWASPRRKVRTIGTAGFGGWRAEYLPR